MNIFIITFFSTLFFYSCQSQELPINNCLEKFKAARELSFQNPTNISKLDSALYLTNQLMKCDSIKIEAVDLKIALLTSMHKYEECKLFIDSLDEADFKYPYKQNMMSKGVLALSYFSINDSMRRNQLYMEIAQDLEKYIIANKMSDEEFKEIYTDLLSIKDIYLNDNQINEVIEKLKINYPSKRNFFEFFKK